VKIEKRSTSDVDGAPARTSSVGAVAGGRAAAPTDPAAPDGRTAPTRPGDGPWPANTTPAPLEGIAPSPDSNPPFRSVGFTVSTIGYAVARRFREILAPLELEPREFALLRAVATAEGLSQQAMGERLQIPASRMVAFVDALEARGLLERRHNPEDRRTRALHLTEVGRELLERAFAVAAGYERDLCADLDGAERERLLDLLQRVGPRLGLEPGVHAAHAHSALADEPA
jgi:DNA-binding MarR family transcriptional regulator